MAATQPPESHPITGRDVFISYASHDKTVAEAACTALESAGLLCWIAPRDVVPGESFAGAIVKAIDATRVIVLILSEHSAASQHVLREVERASSKRHPVIALRIDLAPMPADFEYFLNTSQWLDASAIGVKHALPRLVDAVMSAMALPSAGIRAVPDPSAAMTGPRRNRTLVATAVIALLLVIAGSALWHIARAPQQPSPFKVATTPQTTTALEHPVAAAPTQRSIAVLPFVDMSEKHDQEYFSDGLSEELIDHLTHIPDLKVIARTSSFAFKGKNEDMRSIATKLGVANLLEGSVRKSAGELRITAQLIRASDGVHLWSETYDRKLTDIFKIQDEISTTVAKALNVALTTLPTRGDRAISHGTANIEAYNLLLQGTYFFLRGNSGDNAKAVEIIRQALKMDPSYAVAWARLARVYALQGLTEELTGAEAEAGARDAVRRALLTDPNCAEAYFARGRFGVLVGDRSAANSDFARAIALDPHSDMADRAQLNILSSQAFVSGQFNEVITFLSQMLQRNPLDAQLIGTLASAHQMNGQQAESAVAFRRLLEINPGTVYARASYSFTLLLLGKHVEALAEAGKEPDEASRNLALACVYWAMGRHTESNSALSGVERDFADGNAYEIAEVYAYRGEADAAFRWLDRAYRRNRGPLGILKVDPFFLKLHGDSRFDAWLRKVKLL